MDTSSTMSNYTKPVRNWADDEDDDFDLDTWMASTDTSSLARADLPPLQHPKDDSEEGLIRVSPPKDICLSSKQIFNVEESESPSSQSSFDLDEWQVQQATKVLIERALYRNPERPAFPDMSLDWDIRLSYTSSWNKMKANSGLDCRRPIPFLFSPLAQVTCVDDEEYDPQHPLLLQNNVEEEVEEAVEAEEQPSEIAIQKSTPPSLPPRVQLLTFMETEYVTTRDPMELDFEDVFQDHKDSGSDSSLSSLLDPIFSEDEDNTDDDNTGSELEGNKPMRVDFMDTLDNHVVLPDQTTTFPETIECPQGEPTEEENQVDEARDKDPVPLPSPSPPAYRATREPINKDIAKCMIYFIWKSITFVPNAKIGMLAAGLVLHGFW